VLGHQFLGQVPDSLRQAVIGNVGTLIAFRIGAEDSHLIAAELGRNNPGELTDTPNFHAWTKLIEQGVPANATYVATVSPEPGLGRFDAVRARSRARHARPRQLVEERIAAFFQNETKGGRHRENHSDAQREKRRSVWH
jgi:hypothetical protein